jgi:5-aminolevulinate synthase
MFDYVGGFQSAVAALKRERRYRVFADLARKAGQFPFALWNNPSGKREVVVWCWNDLLGMSQHPKVIDAMCTAARRMGAGGTRAHDVRLIGELADAMVSMWKEIGLPLGRDYPPVEQRAETVAAGG